MTTNISISSTRKTQLRIYEKPPRLKNGYTVTTEWLEQTVALLSIAIDYKLQNRGDECDQH